MISGRIGHGSIDSHISTLHPCFSGEANVNHGRVHLPVSPTCNIQCRFCKRSIGGDAAQRPGVSAEILKPQEAVLMVRRALEICPEITVAGIAGPGDTLATPHALETFALIHQEFPTLINCLSTNGLLLEQYAEEAVRVGVKTLTVTVNAVDPELLARICSAVFLNGKLFKGTEGAALLIEAQKRGIKKAAEQGIAVKVNIVLIPAINGEHIEEIAAAAAENGAKIVNIIPLIPQGEFADFAAPDCTELALARRAAEQYLPVFRHCQHCRADACGIPGKGDLSSRLYSERRFEETFSHG
ncbi:radical SAM protein [Breznakiellaceae bacterium SP9]